MRIDRRVRWYQRPLHEHMMAGGTRAIEIAHRRWGKDEIALDVTCALAHRRVGSYWHCLPEYAQGRKALWTAVNPHTGRRRMDEAFPPEIRARSNDQEMFIELTCGSTWQIIGSDRYDATVGAGVAGIVYSEWALANPSAWAYHRPMLAENGGWALFITTPRGKNHAHSMYKHASADPGWYAEISTVEDTGALDDVARRETLREYQAIYGDDFGRAQYEQEYLCSFNAAIMGAFYASEMLVARSSGQIAPVEHDPDRPVHTAWDIGVRDDTSIWWWQAHGAGWRLLDCYTASGVGVGHFAEVVRSRAMERGWIPGVDWVPHDAKVTEWGTGRTRVEAMIAEGLRPQLVPALGKADGIQAAREMIRRAQFHPRCEAGLAALEGYRREWDDDKKCFRASEVRDWTTHLADAFRYFSVAAREAPPPQPKKEPFWMQGGVVIGPPEPDRGRRLP